jgi:DNA-binding Lrp family transcriptional regulator
VAEQKARKSPSQAAEPKDIRPADLDEVDRRLLTLLHADARISNSALADAVGIAPSTCHGRVRRLRDLGVIRGFDADPSAKKKSAELKPILFDLKLDADETMNIAKEAPEQVEALRQIYLRPNDFLVVVK